ncbi:hypothetical protein DICSQDRAFT_128566 [Dichomitus squalens LYAD-421 SS1]|uniref:Peptidase S28 n=1 Tax=Dichomitus squalens (strain LYAD-421) TaxID=732165 RepID=R7SSQ6_DICSQ|nr:uncharacterized protein DICSQDRAFT_128566 [Dichomitus squalens LYAD-421 SS1]EJF58988.1 hypothetical protein DICSQDRAFT_128566 [Dichomitus squalens LYAD-421 SS1]
MRLSTSTLILAVVGGTLAAPGPGSHILAARQSSAGDPGGAVQCPADTQWFDQPIDHASTNSSQTFKQRYQIDTSNFKEGGPILFYQSPEATDIACISELLFMDWAKELGGIVATLEHRYFGQSLPFGNNSYTLDNLKPFTLDNVMQDAVHFLDFVKKNVTGAAKSKTIVAGGSYGGFLAPVFRQNYPDTFFGAWGIAGPFRSLGTVDEVGAELHNWYNYVQSTYAHRSLEAFDRIRNGFAQVKQLIDTGHNATLTKELSLCHPPSNSSDDLATFASFLVSSYTTMSQFNGLPPAVFFNVSGNSLDVVVNDTLAAPTPLAGINQTLWHAHGLDAVNGCLNYTDAQNSGFGVQEIPFMWAQCNWFPLNLAIANDSIFNIGSPGLGMSSSPSATCETLFNLTQVNGADVLTRYNVTREDIGNSTHIIFSENEYDPTTSVAVPPDWLGDNVSTDIDKSVVLFVAGTGHGQDLARPNATDPSSLTAVRSILTRAY